jgi:hypothetical protein
VQVLTPACAVISPSSPPQPEEYKNPEAELVRPVQAQAGEGVRTRVAVAPHPDIVRLRCSPDEAPCGNIPKTGNAVIPTALPHHILQQPAVVSLVDDGTRYWGKFPS